MQKMYIFFNDAFIPMMIEFLPNYFKMAWCIQQEEYDEFNQFYFDEAFKDSKECHQYWKEFYQLFPELEEQQNSIIYPYSRLPAIRTDENLSFDHAE